MEPRVNKTPRVIANAEKRMMIFDLIKYGFSYSRVGELMGMSKNAVSGYVYRDKHDKPKKLDPHKSRATAIKNVVSLDMPETNEGITIFELKHNSCRYMIGDHKYCGDTVLNRSYCETHYKACYVPNKKRSK